MTAILEPATPLSSPLRVLPTRLRTADLLRITDQTAAEVLDGRHDAVLPHEWDETRRWSTRLHADDDVDVWLISWTPGTSTELHDHAGSLGALTVLSGSLTEYRWTTQGLRDRVLDAGDQAAFPLGWVHDVMRTPNAPITVDPTLSVHAYSPPLTAMSYYEVTPAQNLRRVRTELTDEPE
ncbi:cysteine dioxygenase family protein [Williamsia sp. CHRR-6]|uniref:cysteine dioxygenase n=1 Tax=Williamsia sp. CHRR-6 TaxID=2835871 RepID=UPI001BD96CB2|nr:cysteine dioxygenase family protein [Williamsia sp. CHRR-6]MBT0565525.1 cysteine dioxygenase family protein [Williamsia sp. CHRR-6]